MAIGNTMGLLNQLIQQNPNIQNQMFQPTNPINGGLIALPDPSQGMNRPRRPDPFGMILPDQGFTPLPDPRFGTGGPIIGDPSVQPTLIQDQMFQPPMTTVSGGVNSFPNAFDPRSQFSLPYIEESPPGQFVQPRRPEPFPVSTFTEGPGLQNLPGANQGINLPISIGNNPSLNPIQDQMFRPPMEQPVQNQMPVANSFLEQLQQSAGLLQNQVTALQPPVVNNVPQNRFVGNQFQMPFGMGQPTPFGGNYGSGGFNLPYNPGSYTPGEFNQYGNIGTTAGIDNIISRLLGPGANNPGSGRDAMGRDKDQGASVRDTHEVINGVAYRINRETGEVDKLDGLDASIAKTLAGYLDNATITGIMNRETYQEKLDRIKDISPEAYNDITANVREQARVAGVPETKEKFHLGDFIGGLLGLGDPDGDNNPTGPGIGDIDSPQDNAREQARGNRGNNGPGAGGTVGGSNQGGYGDGAGGACFDPNTYIKMQDGSEKKIKDVQLGDFTKGGKVTGVLQFEPIDDIHEYKGVIVAGSHFVKEGNEFIMVQDSPESIKIDKIPVVYSLDTSNRRIFINDIEFADYNGDGIAKNFLNNAGIDLSGFDKEVLRQVEHRLI